MNVHRRLKYRRLYVNLQPISVWQGLRKDFDLSEETPKQVSQSLVPPALCRDSPHVPPAERGEGNRRTNGFLWM